MEQTELQRAIEAILFAAGEPVETGRLAMVLETDEADIEALPISTIIRALQITAAHPISATDPVGAVYILRSS